MKVPQHRHAEFAAMLVERGMLPEIAAIRACHVDQVNASVVQRHLDAAEPSEFVPGTEAAQRSLVRSIMRTLLRSQEERRP